MEKSLWLSPRKKPVDVNLRERFKHYPYFEYSFGQYLELEVPEIVKVTWQPIEPLLRTLEGDDDEIAEHEAWIQEVKGMMKEGLDIPPVLLDDDDVFDGRHRTWAAHELGIKLVPVVDLTPYWVR